VHGSDWGNDDPEGDVVAKTGEMVTEGGMWCMAHSGGMVTQRGMWWLRQEKW
jgi:hypothetical protein